MPNQKKWNRLLGLTAAVGLLLGYEAAAAPRLPGFFTDNMVIQRDREVPVWGWADAGEAVVVAFADQSVEAIADASGAWRATLPPMSASTNGRVFSVSSKRNPASDPILLANVVVGDVWICSGQSNMEWTLRRRIMNSRAEIAAADYPLIRHMKVPNNTADLPLDDLTAAWQVSSPATVDNFSGVGYFFARHLYRELGVPIGLIGSNWGGTRIEPWTPPEGFRSVPELAGMAARVDATLPSTEAGRMAYREAFSAMREWIPLAEANVEKGLNPPAVPMFPAQGTGNREPTRIYNAMIHPLIPFAIRGAIWYQGESNGSEGIEYYHKKQALIGGWRTLWDQGDFPFYFVQLANLGKPTDDPAGGDGYSRIREAQRQSLAIPNTGMAVIIDIGEAGDIHPANKQDVGLRLALWAMGNEYGRENLVFSGPLFKTASVEQGAIRVTFEHAGSGLMVGTKNGLDPVVENPEGDLTRFAIAGEDRQWHWADARIDGQDSVIVSSPSVPAPVAVRYAFSHNPAGCNLYNREGLPASPFRTDDW